MTADDHSVTNASLTGKRRTLSGATFLQVTIDNPPAISMWTKHLCQTIAEGSENMRLLSFFFYNP
jgi:hypothetical protein